MHLRRSHLQRFVQSGQLGRKRLSILILAKDLCIKEPLLLTALSSTHAIVAYEQGEFLNRRRLTLVVELTRGQVLTGIVPGVLVQIGGKPSAYERKIFVPDVLTFIDGRIKLPGDPNSITATR